MKPRFVRVVKGLNRLTAGGNVHSILHAWRSGQRALAPFVSPARSPALDSAITVRVEKCLEAYKSADLPDQHFDTAYASAREYVISRKQHLHINADDNRQLTAAEVNQLDDELPGVPPVSCYPIYFMTVAESSIQVTGLTETSRVTSKLPYHKFPGPDTEERVVYVGRTFAAHRFENGHRALTKLHDPKYDGLEKWLYLCRLVYRDPQGDELPLEWISDLNLAKLLLASAEGQLIRAFDPELNDKNEPITHHKNYVIANYATDSPVLDGIIGFANFDPGLVPQGPIVQQV